MTGFGMKEFFEAVDEARKEYETYSILFFCCLYLLMILLKILVFSDYRPELVRRKQERERLKEEQKNENLNKLVKDLKLSAASSSSFSRKITPKDPTELRPDELSQWEEPDAPILDKRK